MDRRRREDCAGRDRDGSRECRGHCEVDCCVVFVDLDRMNWIVSEDGKVDLRDAKKDFVTEISMSVSRRGKSMRLKDVRFGKLRCAAEELQKTRRG